MENLKDSTNNPIIEVFLSNFLTTHFENLVTDTVETAKNRITDVLAA